MGRLVLVRHAQASFLAADYDRLSPLGEEQARLLGEYWADRGVEFDRIFSGPRVRQKDTAKIARAAYGRTDVEFPEPTVMDEFDEYEGERVLRASLPQLAESDSFVRELHDAFLASPNPGEQRRNFQKLFEAVIGKWVDGEIVVQGVESWPEFSARVHRGLSKVVSGAGSNEQVAIFSSGGPIAVAMQRALNLSPRDTLRTSWMSRNCSYSEFLFSADRFTLSTFNAFPYLREKELWTYR
jgi:broad specificity phosphatase PhoE